MYIVVLYSVYIHANRYVDDDHGHDRYGDDDGDVAYNHQPSLPSPNQPNLTKLKHKQTLPNI